MKEIHEAPRRSEVIRQINSVKVAPAIAPPKAPRSMNLTKSFMGHLKFQPIPNLSIQHTTSNPIVDTDASAECSPKKSACPANRLSDRSAASCAHASVTNRESRTELSPCDIATAGKAIRRASRRGYAPSCRQPDLRRALC